MHLVNEGTVVSTKDLTNADMSHTHYCTVYSESRVDSAGLSGNVRFFFVYLPLLTRF